MASLANCLTFLDTSVQYAAAGALAVLGCDAIARAKVSNINLLMPMIMFSSLYNSFQMKV